VITDGLTPLNLLALFALVGGSAVAALAIGAARIAGRREVARWFARCLGAGFDVPAGAGDLQLEIASLVPPTWLVIGHENSFLHKKTTFRLGA
jgi:hypothetical protein